MTQYWLTIMLLFSSFNMVLAEETSDSYPIRPLFECFARNNYGYLFWAYGYFPNEAESIALDECYQASYGPYPTYCFALGCREIPY